MSPDVSLEIASFSELSLTSDEWTVQEALVISLYFGELFCDLTIFWRICCIT